MEVEKVLHKCLGTLLLLRGELSGEEEVEDALSKCKCSLGFQNDRLYFSNERGSLSLNEERCYLGKSGDC